MRRLAQDVLAQRCRSISQIAPQKGVKATCPICRSFNCERRTPLFAETESAQTEVAIGLAEAELAAAEADLYLVLEALNKFEIIAPQDGTVTSINTGIGETITANAPVITIADLSGWLVETKNVTELDVPFIEVGDSVKVRLDAFPGQVLDGEIVRIAPKPSMFLGDIVYPVTVQLENEPELPLRWGMTAVIEMDLE